MDVNPERSSVRADGVAEDASVTNDHRPQPVAAAIVGVLVATGVAAAVVTLGIKHSPKSKDFSDHIEYVTWATLAIGLAAVAVMGAVFSLPAWRDLHARSSRSARWISYCIGLLVTLCYDVSPAVVVRLLMQRGSSPLDGSLFREIVLAVIVGVATLPALSGLVLAALLLNRQSMPRSGTSGRDEITDLLRIRAQIQRFLAVLALVIGGNIVSVAAFRAALLAYAPQPPLQPVVLLVYGVMMTGLLALLYVPAYLAWQNAAQGVRDALYPLPLDGRPDPTWYTGRADLEGLLNLKVNAAAAFTTGLGLLTPFASSLFTAVVSQFKAA